jgi:hypothetical protein
MIKTKEAVNENVIMLKILSSNDNNMLKYFRLKLVEDPAATNK